MKKDADLKIPTILSINMSKGGIPKLPVEQAYIRTQGLEGDEHNHEKHYRLEQAVCLQDIEKLKELKGEGYPLEAGTTGENITVEHLNVNGLALGTVLIFENGVEIEVSKVRKPCYVLDTINPQLKVDIEGRCGMYARVLKEGNICVGEKIAIRESPLNV